VVARARRDRAAFGEIYDYYLPRVYAFCRLYSASQEEAEDLIAQTFERALQAIHRYDERGAPLSSWLLRIAANAAKDRHRRSWDRLNRVPVLNLDHATSWPHKWEQTYWLRGHVKALPLDQQEVVRLRFYEDQPFAAVASHMGRSEGAVKQLLRPAP
jgi:RNA polymerase sigma-70 factor, ECF subfamily